MPPISHQYTRPPINVSIAHNHDILPPPPPILPTGFVRMTYKVGGGSNVPRPLLPSQYDVFRNQRHEVPMMPPNGPGAFGPQEHQGARMQPQGQHLRTPYRDAYHTGDTPRSSRNGEDFDNAFEEQDYQGYEP